MTAEKYNYSFALFRDYFNSFKFYPLGTKLVGVAFRLRKEMKNLPSCARVLHRTLNLVISRCCFAEDGRRNVVVSNDLCEHLRAGEQRVYFCEHEQLTNFACEQRAL